MTSHEFVMLEREALASCMTCRLCHKIFRDPTTITECIHTFCRKCIYNKILDGQRKSCPVCNINLGCTPLDKLRSDHNLQDIREKTFPSKSIMVRPAEMVTPVTLHVKGKEKSPLLDTRMSGDSTNSGVAKFSNRKTSVGSHSNLRKTLKQHDSYSDSDSDSDSSSSMEVIIKYTRNSNRNSFATGSFADLNLDKGKEKLNSEMKIGMCKQLNCVAAAKNKSKPPKLSTQVSVTKPKVVTFLDNEGLINKENGQEEWQDPIHGVTSDKKDICLEQYIQEKPKRCCMKTRNFRKSTIAPGAVRNASNGNFDLTNHPIWFSLVASEKMEGNDLPLPQISAMYIRVKDGRMPISYIQKYLRVKLDLTCEDEVEIKCMGQRVTPTWTLNNLMKMWLQTTSAERVPITIGSSAKDFVMELNYARGVPDLNEAPTISLSP